MAAKSAAAEAEREAMRSKTLTEMQNSQIKFNEERERERTKFGDNQRHTQEAHTKDMQRKDAMAMHESTTRANSSVSRQKPPSSRCAGVRRQALRSLDRGAEAWSHLRNIGHGASSSGRRSITSPRPATS